MSHTPDSRQQILADLQAWLRQNDGDGAYYFDEGPVAEPVEAAPEPVVEQATSEPAPPPTQAPKPQASVIDDPFELSCRAFVDQTLELIRRQAQTEPQDKSVEPLLEHHAGDATAALEDLRQDVLPCTSCGLHSTRTKTVFGAGSAQAKIVFIGEAPGRDEDLQGEPFVGASGQLLTKILGAVDFARDDVFICNILKCRPPGNRDPQPDEVAVCEAHLKRQLAIIQPRLICCLGRIAAQTLLGTETSLGALRKTVHFYEGIPVMATYHPAALLRNPAWKRDTWNDVRKMKALHDALA